MLRRLGVIGAGSMAATVLETIAEELPEPLEQLSLVVSETSREAGGALLQRLDGRVARTSVLRETADAVALDWLDVVAECAGHQAVRQYGPAVLAAATDFMVASVGALADDDLRRELEQAALRSGARLQVPPGAVGGIDALVAARLSGLDSVVYVGRKPPRAWRGTKAERRIDLDAVHAPVMFYDGSAREAAREYPQNANVAATVALAGVGFDDTRVQLIADPGIARNVHEITVRSACADFTIRLEGHPSPANPKTSLTAGYSIARALLNRVASVEI